MVYGRCEMIGLSRLAYEKLRGENSSQIKGTPIDWWKKSKIATIWLVACLILEIPFVIIKYIIMAICFIPHKIYEELE